MVVKHRSLTLREKFRLRVFENRILRRTFGPKMGENGDWRRLHNEKLHSLYRSPNINRIIESSRLRCTGYVVRRRKEFFQNFNRETFRKEAFGKAT